MKLTLKNHKLFILFSLIFCVCFSYSSYAQAVITSARSGNWTTGNTWTNGSQPAAGNSVVITSGHVVLVNSNISMTFANITIQNGGILIVSGNNTSLAASGNLQVISNSGGAGGSLVITERGTVNIGGSADISEASVFIEGATDSRLIVGKNINHGSSASSSNEIFVDYTGLTAGRLYSVNANTTYRQTGGILKLTATSTSSTDADFVVEGNISIDNSKFSTNGGQESTIHFERAGKISIPVGATTNFYNIICDAPVDATNSGININITNKLSLGATGSLNIAGNTLNFDKGATVTGNLGGSNISDFSANNSVKVVSNSGVVKYTSDEFFVGSYIFPISVASTYLGAAISIGAPGGTELSVKPVTTAPNYEPTVQPYTYLTAYWDIFSVGISATSRVEFLTNAVATNGTSNMSMPTSAVVVNISSPSSSAIATEVTGTSNTVNISGGNIIGVATGTSAPLTNYWTIAELPSDKFYSLNTGNWDNTSGGTWTHSENHTAARIVPAGRKPISTSTVVIAAGHEITVSAASATCATLNVGTSSGISSPSSGGNSGYLKIINGGTLGIVGPGASSEILETRSANSSINIESGATLTVNGMLQVRSSSSVVSYGTLTTSNTIRLEGGGATLAVNSGVTTVTGSITLNSGAAQLNVTEGQVNISTDLAINGNSSQVSIIGGKVVANVLRYGSGTNKVLNITNGILAINRIYPASTGNNLVYNQSGGIVELTPTNPTTGFENPDGHVNISAGLVCFKAAGLINVPDNTTFYDIVCDAPVTARKSNMNLNITRMLALTSSNSSLDVSMNTLTIRGQNSKIVSGDTATANTALRSFNLNRAVLIGVDMNSGASGKLVYDNLSSPSKNLIYPIVVTQNNNKYLLGMSATFSSTSNFGNGRMEVSPVASNPNLSGFSAIDAYWKTNVSGLVTQNGIVIDKLDLYFSEALRAGFEAGKIYETTTPVTIRAVNPGFEKLGSSEEYRYVESTDLAASQIGVTDSKIWTIIAASQTTVRSGRWSDPLVWETGVAPTANDDVVINGHIVYTGLYDSSGDILGHSQYALAEEDVPGIDNSKSGVSKLCKSLTIENDAVLNKTGALIIGNNAPSSNTYGRRVLHFGNITNGGTSQSGANILLDWNIGTLKTSSGDPVMLGGLYIMQNSSQTFPNGFEPQPRALNLFNSGSVYNASLIEIGDEDCN